MAEGAASGPAVPDGVWRSQPSAAIVFGKKILWTETL